MSYTYDLGGGYVGSAPVANVTPDLVPVRPVTTFIGDDHTIEDADRVVVFTGTGVGAGHVYLQPATGSFRELVLTNAGTTKMIVDAGSGCTINNQQTQTVHRGASMTIIDRIINQWSIA